MRAGARAAATRAHGSRRRRATGAAARAGLLVLAALGGADGGAAAAAGFARGSVRIDVRDERGAPVEAAPSLRAADGSRRATTRVGDVYVADGLPAGAYDLLLADAGGDAGAAPQPGRASARDDGGAARRADPRRVVVKERHASGAVVVLPAPGDRRATRRRAGGDWPAVSADGRVPLCLVDGGAPVAAVAFVGDRPAAGWIDVRRAAGQRGREAPVCGAAIAGGTADLRLPPGDYVVGARFVGASSVRLFYRIVPGRAPPPLVLRPR